jgi:hypothetical protein
VRASDKLESLRKLAHNWDGEGSLPIDPEVIRYCRAFLNLFANPDAHSIIPTHDGGIQIETYVVEGPNIVFNIEIEFVPDKCANNAIYLETVE